MALQDSLDHEMNPTDSVSLNFPLLSDVAAEEMDARIIEEERTLYGHRLRNSITEPIDGVNNSTAEQPFSPSPYTTRSSKAGPSSVRGKNGKNRRKLTAEFDMPVERPREPEATSQALQQGGSGGSALPGAADKT